MPGGQDGFLQGFLTGDRTALFCLNILPAADAALPRTATRPAAFLRLHAERPAMQQSGQRFINAPRAKVWTALLDAQTLSACFSAPDMVRKDGEASFRIGPPISQTVTLAAVQAPGSLTYAAPRGNLHVTLAEEGPQMTRLSYVLEAPAIAGLQAQADSVLDAFQQQVAGPREIAAGGLANAQAAGTGT